MEILNQSKVSFLKSVNDSEVDQRNEKIVERYLAYKPDSELNNVDTKRESKNNNNFDPLTLIDIMLTSYIRNQMNKADAIAAEISEKSKAVAEINRLWGTLMTKNIGNVDPTKVDKKTDIQRNSNDEYYKIDEIIKNTLGESKGINVITNKHTHNYDELQSANATMTAYSDTIQVDLDTTQQEFKNIMTAITSAQEEIRDIRRIVVSFAER
ncbi:hypothetical protein [Providencia rettgeri]|uniref:hypothetical protein n=1 Tax=Providencia rettgeri TaxID=587 RepID=UPI000D7D3533|nr:hypothetical protein [Providencia rettgeri]AWS50760.1 hypothetical protein AM461_08020 [Providencia rettgeri]